MTELENTHNLFKPQGFGIINGDNREIYESCKRKYVIVRDRADYSDTLYKFFETLISGNQLINLLSSQVLNASNVLTYLLDVHRNHQSLQGTRSIEKDYRFTEVVFIELTTHVSHTVEYITLVYFYLLNLGIPLFELYLIVSYKTTKFDFIETSIFGRKNFKSEEPPKEIESKSFLLTYINSSFQGKKIVVISENDLFKKELEASFTEQRFQMVFYDDPKNYQDEEDDNIYLKIIMLKNIDEFLESKIEPFMVILDPRVKIPSNTMYSGNIQFPMQYNKDYVKDCEKRVAARSKRIQFYKYGIKEEQEVIRGVFKRSPITDFVDFYNHGIDLNSLYTKYYQGSEMRSFLGIMRGEINVLENIGFFSQPEKFNNSVNLNIHPLFISMILEWYRRGYPKLSILLFVATVLTQLKVKTEVKEHGVREHDSDFSMTSHFGKDFSEYLKTINNKGTLEIPEFSKRTKILKKLIEKYKIEDSDILIPSIEDFIKFFSRMVLENYPTFVLRSKEYQKYANVFNTQMNYRIAIGNITFAQILPIKVIPMGTYKFVEHYIPIVT